MPDIFAHLSLSERLLRGVEYDTVGGCWLWWRSCDRHGYGRLVFQRKAQFAHRASYRAHVGPIPNGLGVCHHCDTPACINPDHLFLGDQKANIGDASRKRRTPLGERQGRSKLKDADVLEIRAMAARGDLQKVIARRFGIKQPTVSEIVGRKKWPHI